MIKVTLMFFKRLLASGNQGAYIPGGETTS